MVPFTVADDTHKADHDKGPADTRPFLSIPYWESPRFPGDAVDVGATRPLPGGVISWDCQAIHASPYAPGGVLDVTVDVRNSGPGNATAVPTVIVYWADPTVGFAHPIFFGATTVVVPPMRDPFQPGFVTSPVVRGIIPAGAPPHICLLAVVTHSLDKAASVADPLNDRHWAQRNLVAVTAGSGGSLIVPFVVANPLAAEGLFELRVHALDRRTLEVLALRMKMEPSEAPLRLRLLDERGQSVADRASEGRTQLALGRHKRRRFALALEVERLEPHQVAAVEAVLYSRAGGDKPIGSLGIVVKGADDAT